MSNSIDNKLAGDVWVKELQMSEIENAPENPQLFEEQAEIINDGLNIVDSDSDMVGASQ